MKVKIKTGCKCGADTDIVIKKPHLVQKTFATYICIGCGSRLKCLVSKIVNSTQVNVEWAVIEVSKKLKTKLNAPPKKDWS